MEGQYLASENKVNNKDVEEMKNELTVNKLKLRKNHLNNFLIQKAMTTQDNEIENQIFQDLKNDSYTKQHEEIKKILSSNNDQNLIKALNYIHNIFCVQSFNSKLKSDILRCGMSDLIINLYYNNSNESIFPLCCSILSILCTDYFEFSTRLINEEGIKIIYDRVSKNFCNNIDVVSNCIIIYNESLAHLQELVQKSNTKFSNLSYNSKKYLCHFTNWILSEKKKIFLSFRIDIFLEFFKLIKLLKTAISVPNQYELDFEQGNDSIDNLFSYVLEQPVKDLEYFGLQCYLELLIMLSKDKKYTIHLTSGNKNVFDVIKRLCGFIYLNNNSSKEDRDNFVSIEPFMLGYCFEIMANLCLEVIKRDDIIDLIYIFFKNYRYTAKYNDQIPSIIMDLLVRFSENIYNDERIYKFMILPERNILFYCIKFYAKSNTCFVKVMQILINIFEVKNFDDIENIKNEKLIKCISEGLEIENVEVNRKSVYCLGKIIEINGRKKYNIDLLKYFEINHTLENLKNLVLNKNYKSIAEEENAEDLIAYIENMIKFEENK